MKTKDGLKVKKPVTLIRPQRFPNVMKCDCCGSIMIFDSIDMGYSCTNKECPLSIDYDEESECYFQGESEILPHQFDAEVVRDEY